MIFQRVLAEAAVKDQNQDNYFEEMNKIETINRCERINMKCFENIIKEHCVTMKYLFLNFLMFKLIFLVENSKYLIE